MCVCDKERELNLTQAEKSQNLPALCFLSLSFVVSDFFSSSSSYRENSLWAPPPEINKQVVRTGGGCAGGGVTGRMWHCQTSTSSARQVPPLHVRISTQSAGVSGGIEAREQFVHTVRWVHRQSDFPFHIQRCQSFMHSSSLSTPWPLHRSSLHSLFDFLFREMYDVDSRGGERVFLEQSLGWADQCQSCSWIRCWMCLYRDPEPQRWKSGVGLGNRDGDYGSVRTGNTACGKF